MKTNVSKTDRIIRIILGALLLALGLGGVIGGTLGVVFIILGFISVITGLVGFCPLYALLKIKTN